MLKLIKNIKKSISLTYFVSNSQMLYFDIINIHIIKLRSLLRELINNEFHLFHYTIETHTCKNIGGSVSFQYGINIFFLY